MSTRTDSPRKQVDYRVFGLTAKGLQTYVNIRAYSHDQAVFKAKSFKGLIRVMDARPM